MVNEIQISYNFHLSQSILLIFSQPFKSVKSILSLEAVQKQVADQIWPMGHNLPTSDKVRHKTFDITFTKMNVLSRVQFGETIL